MPQLQAIGWQPFFEEQWKGVARSGFVRARIAAEHRGRFDTWTEGGELEARLAGRLKRELRGEARPTVGDFVALREGSGLATVERVFSRHSAFVRRAVGERDAAQVVAANVDAVLLVLDVSADFNPRRVERFLAQLFESRARPVVVLNKADLAPEAEARLGQTRRLLSQVAVHLVSARRGEGMGELAAYAGPGQTVALVGASGAGKSSIANALAQGEVMRVGGLARDGRGSHTTTHRQLIPLSSGGLLLDTPGMRELGLWGSDEGVGEVFDDIAALAAGCRFSDCAHAAEPGCVVREAVDAGRLDAGRLAHFQRLRQEAGRRAKPWLAQEARPARKPAPS